METENQTETNEPRGDGSDFTALVRCLSQFPRIVMIAGYSPGITMRVIAMLDRMAVEKVEPQKLYAVDLCGDIDRSAFAPPEDKRPYYRKFEKRRCT